MWGIYKGDNPLVRYLPYNARFSSEATWKPNASIKSPRRSRTWTNGRRSCGGIFDFEGKEKRLTEVETLLTDPKVWNDPKRAQRLGREKKSLDATVTRLAAIASSLRDSRGLFEMARAENDDATLSGIAEDIAKLEKEVGDLEVDENIEVEINPADLRIDTYRASGAGGQHVNKTDSAVRITHLPTGIVVQCQNDRSQHRNRAEAMAMLKSRLYELELRKLQADRDKLESAKTEIEWGHQIRSYVLDQSRIKDLRTGVEKGDTQRVLDGDLGDILGAKGTLFKTRTGELSVKVTDLRLLVKALRPLPEKFHGLADQEQKYRQRYVDLIMSEETRGVFRTRSRIVQAIREFMAGKGFLEVETPMMQPIPGGANARPFKTHHNALDMDLFLRVAPELYLKRLVVGGLEKVFEINRNFRNEGISTQHNPEFTMLEFYEAYRDYRYLMDFTEGMLRDLAQKVLGTLELRCGKHTIDLAGPFERLTILQAVRKFYPEIGERELRSPEALIAALKKRGIEPPAKAGIGALHLAL